MFETDRILAWHALRTPSFPLPIEKVRMVAVVGAPAWFAGDVIGTATGTFPGLGPHVVETIAGPMFDDGAVLVVRGKPCWIAPQYLAPSQPS